MHGYFTHVVFRRILKEARDERGRKIFKTFSSDDLSFLVAEWSRWDKYKRAPWRQDSSASAGEGWWREDQEQLIVSWSPVEKRVMGAVEDNLESCAHVKVDIEVVERLPRPANLEVSLRYVLKHATGRGSNIFQLFDTPKKAEPLWQAEDACWKVREETVHGKRMGKTSGMTLSVKEPGRKPRRAPTEPYEDSPVKAPPPSRRMTPHTPLQNHTRLLDGSRSITRWTDVEAREKARRGVKVHLLHQMKDRGKWEWKSSVVRGAHRKEKC